MSELTIEHIRKLEQAGDERGRKIDAVISKVDSVNKWRPSVDRKLEKHDHALFGNGEPGMDEMIRQLFTWMNEQKAKEQDKTGEIKKYTFFFVTFLIAELILRYVLP